MNLRDQFKYVNKIVITCENDLQKSNAHKWAWEWSKRAKVKHPNIIHSHTDLFIDVVRKWPNLK